VTRKRLTLCDPVAYRLGYGLDEPTILAATGIASEVTLQALGEGRTEIT
jgi:hypothetical protein